MPSSKGFAGFPPGKLKVTPIPQPFFSELLPAIDHLGELKVTLYAFWALARKEERFQYLRREDMAADALFLGGMAAAGMSPEEACRDVIHRMLTKIEKPEVTFTVLNKEGQYASVSTWGCQSFVFSEGKTTAIEGVDTRFEK